VQRRRAGAVRAFSVRVLESSPPVIFSKNFLGSGVEAKIIMSKRGIFLISS